MLIGITTGISQALSLFRHFVGIDDKAWAAGSAADDDLAWGGQIIDDGAWRR